jgi:Ca-activated chloride channel homolog
MKLRNVVLSSVAGMALTSTAVYSFTPAPRASAASPPPAVGAEDAPAASATLPSSFHEASTLEVEGRLANARIAKGDRGQTYLMLEVKSGAGSVAASAAPSHLAIVIDRSGSMKGDRIVNARAGAKAAVDRLGDGDLISVVAFDTSPTTVVPSTRIDPSSRASVKAAIDRISLGGDTCISCGIEAGMRELATSNDKVDRMIVLSDGDATDGVRDVAGFEAIAQRARGMGAAISTIGLGLGYNQRILGAVAQQAGGGHYFLESAASLDRVLGSEAEALRSTVAVEAEAVIDPGEGVSIARVFDRSFERRGRKIVVPLGSFARDDVKTVLVELTVPTGADGPLPVASVDLGYRDLARGGVTHAKGELGLAIGGGATASLDPIIAGRIARSGTADALLRANELAARGQLDEAQRVLQKQQAVVAAAAATPKPSLPAQRRGALSKDLDAQAASIQSATQGLKKNAPKTEVDRSLRHNQELANPFMR